MPVDQRHKRRLKQGRVVSDKMDKTIVVLSETRVAHPVYGKIVRKSVSLSAMGRQFWTACAPSRPGLARRSG